MRCEVVAIGTELLLGQIVDTNSAWIGEHLALTGIDCLRQTKVGDNHDRIVAVLEEALGRADAVICCGGLGPTHDDITREAIASVMGVPLVKEPELVERIRAMFEARGRVMPANNERQAEVPEGASAFDEQPGTAPGLRCPVRRDGQEKVIYAVPGVPDEMRAIMAHGVLPDLRRRSGETTVILSRTLRTWGESESGLAERLVERIERLDEAGNPTMAFNASGIEGLKIRLTAKASDELAASKLLHDEEVAIRELLGDLVFGVDGENMEHAVGRMLIDRDLTLGVAESLTGGLVGARLSEVPGASAWFRGSIVSYDSEVKFDLLDVPEGPVVSEQAVRAMAEGARRVLGATVGIGVTGVAGPAEQDGQPVGTVWLGVALDDEVTARKVQLGGDRARIRQFSVISLLDLLRRRLLVQRPR